MKPTGPPETGLSGAPSRHRWHLVPSACGAQMFPPNTHPFISRLRTVRGHHTKLQSSVDLLSCNTATVCICFIIGYFPLGKVPCIFTWPLFFFYEDESKPTKISMKLSNYFLKAGAKFCSYRSYWHKGLETQKTFYGHFAIYQRRVLGQGCMSPRWPCSLICDVNIKDVLIQGWSNVIA